MSHHLLRTFALTLALGLCWGTGAARADVNVDATLCNDSRYPVEFVLYNAGDALKGALPLDTKIVSPCSCVSSRTHTDLWHRLPLARIDQLTLRSTTSTSTTEVSACLEADGEFEGYVEGGLEACAKGGTAVSFLDAVEITRPVGGIRTLDTKLEGTKACDEKDWLGGCIRFAAHYNYDDGNRCYGND